MVDFGVPQHRERVILVGFKGKNPFIFPQKHMKRDPDSDFLKFVCGVGKLTEHAAPKNGAHLILPVHPHLASSVRVTPELCL